MANPRSSFSVLSDHKDAVTIQDLNKGMSVTNDAENVVAYLRSKGILTHGKRLFYYDTLGCLDEITWTADGRIDFKVYEGQQGI